MTENTAAAEGITPHELYLQLIEAVKEGKKTSFDMRLRRDDAEAESFVEVSVEVVHVLDDHKGVLFELSSAVHSWFQISFAADDEYKMTSAVMIL